MSGFVKIQRASFDHELFRGDEFSRHEAWLWLIASAAWRPHRYRYQKKMIAIERGTLPAGRDHLSKAWGWGEQRVRTFLKELKNEKMITSSTNQGITIITICNYERFQTVEPLLNQPSNQPDNQQLTSSQPAANHTEEGKELKEREEKKERGSNEPLLIGLPAEQLQPEKSKPDRMPILESFEAYQDLALRCGLPQARSLSPALRKSIGARLREYQSKGWTDCLAMIERSSFLCGGNDREFRVNLPWMLKPANFEKIVSGTYGNGREASVAEMSRDQAAKLLAEFTEV